MVHCVLKHFSVNKRQNETENIESYQTSSWKQAFWIFEFSEKLNMLNRMTFSERMKHKHRRTAVFLSFCIYISQSLKSVNPLQELRHQIAH